jgi:hypothetical protein
MAAITKKFKGRIRFEELTAALFSNSKESVNKTEAQQSKKPSPERQKR